ncbi:MAG TPA: hypothetical protein VGL67_08385 [Casimicrobiaceae bacterium]
MCDQRLVDLARRDVLATLGEDELRAHCLATHGRYKTPRYLRFVDALPKGASGKVQRLKLVDLVHP